MSFLRLIYRPGCTLGIVSHANHLLCKGFMRAKQGPVALTGQGNDVRAANETVESALGYNRVRE